MIVSRTPLRVSLLGGGSDYEQHFLKHGGQIIGGSINHYCYVCLHQGNISHFYDLPNKSGLASSSAYTVGLLRATSELDNVFISRLATRLEIEKTGGNVGYQDQYLCAVGGFHHLKFSEHGVRDIPIDMELVRPLEDYLMLFDTHQYRTNRDIIPSQVARIDQNEDLLKQMSMLVDEALKTLKAKDYIEFGRLLGESWKWKRMLSDSVTTLPIESAYADALEAGAVGGKLLGGGGGGFMLFLAPLDKKEEVKRALGDWTYTPFKFEQEGSRVIYRD